jgi:hypothetical protein
MTTPPEKTELFCYYCGKKYRGKTFESARAQLRGHFNYCTPRKYGVIFDFGTTKYNVIPCQIQTLTYLTELHRSVKDRPEKDGHAIFMGALLSEKRNNKIKDFTF